MANGRRTAAVCGAAVGAALLLAGCCSRYRWRGPVTDHFDGRRFFNPEPTDGGFSQYARRTLSSRRGLFDQDRTLWYGFVIEGPSGSVYFAGDTGRGSFLSAPEDAALVSSPRGSSAFLPELLWRGTLSEDEVF